ncbi:Nif3-like dinuclear metal center hexameric protein [Paraconexibacter algicola]|uniref:GTP cyclohydrolase 1 type 2 homolog n=1 Tax=Paraconexibacter algicola TaxID=2133960 RepID=A0A2T4UBS2_9ACTN|nr:Nif3-like dinuclear metal center hexameric protein [Paraconexibacter algicola]PTL54354.1 Nif3-like dinuclear metal center hexameric protein [Paraconexibacter algicola]
MALLDDLLADLDTLLDAPGFPDYAPNGLQVPGRGTVATVVTGVSAGLELLERAVALDADLVLVHHGLFWHGAPLALDRPAARRLRLLLEREISLAAYHLPLDAHLELGNNALLARGIGCERWEAFGVHKGRTIGVAGTFPGDGITREELVSRVRGVCHDREPLVFDAGPERVRRVGIVSGAGSDHLHEAVAAGLDAFVTGEPAERAMLAARENAITFVAAGHYATETHGVRALGDHLAARHGVTHHFVDIWNPI